MRTASHPARISAMPPVLWRTDTRLQRVIAAIQAVCGFLAQPSRVSSIPNPISVTRGQRLLRACFMESRSRLPSRRVERRWRTILFPFLSASFFSSLPRSSHSTSLLRNPTRIISKNPGPRGTAAPFLFIGSTIGVWSSVVAQ